MDENSKPLMSIVNRMDECEGSFEIWGVCWLNFQPTNFVQLTVPLVILLCTKPPPIALVAACLDYNLDFFLSAFVGLFLNLPWRFLISQRGEYAAAVVACQAS